MKNNKFSLTVIKIFMKNQMQNRSYLVLDTFNMLTRCLVLFFLYDYVFKVNGGDINGVSYQSTLWSMFIYFCLMTLKLRNIYTLIMNDVKSGNIEMFINKPVNYIFLTFYKAIGQGLYSFIVISFIGFIAMVIFVGVPSLNLVIFIPTLIIAVILGQILCLIIYSIVGILAFFMQDVRPVYWIVDKTVMVLGGSYLPIALFPKFMKFLAYISPFGAINFASSTVYESWNTEYIKLLLLQIVWIIVFGILLKYTFDLAKKKAMVNGG